MSPPLRTLDNVCSYRCRRYHCKEQAVAWWRTQIEGELFIVLPAVHEPRPMQQKHLEHVMNIVEVQMRGVIYSHLIIFLVP